MAPSSECNDENDVKLSETITTELTSGTSKIAKVEDPSYQMLGPRQNRDTLGM